MIDKQTLILIRTDINAALASVAEKHGLKSLSTDGGRYNSENFTMKLSGVIEGGDDKEAARYKRYQSIYSLPPLGTVFNSRGMSHTIRGLSTRNSVYTRRSDGRSFRFPVDSVVRLTRKST